MALRYGAVVYRNEQEQVAKNASDIEKIFEMLDGLNIQDNVIVVADMSQILRADEIEIVERPIAFIIYNNNVYIKKTESSGEAYFDKIFTITADSEIVFSSEEITVNLITGALSLNSVNASTYSTTTIDNLLAEKASLSGADFTGDVTAKTFEAAESNYSRDITFANTGFQITNVYSKFIIINNVLYCVVNVKMKNISGEAKTLYQFLGSQSLSLPTKYAEKIYDFDGNTVHDQPASETVIMTTQTNFSNVTLSFKNTNPVNGCKIDFSANNGLAFDVDQERRITARFFVTLV